MYSSSSSIEQSIISSREFYIYVSHTGTYAAKRYCWSLVVIMDT